MEMPRLETNRLQWRPVTLADLDDLHRLWIDPGMRKYLWDDNIIPRERVQTIIESSVASFEANHFGLWSVFPRAEVVLIGFTGFWYLHDPPKLELIYGIAPTYWNQGLATEVARTMLQYGFEQLSFGRIEARPTRRIWPR